MSVTQFVRPRRGIVFTVLILVGALMALVLQAVVGTASAAQPRPVEDPVLGYQYRVEVDNHVSGYFTDVYGMGSENDIIEHKVVDVSGQELVRKVPGRLVWGDIVLTRGLTSDTSIWEWRRLVEAGNISEARSNGSIVMYDQTLQEVARWNFENAWPSKVETVSQSGVLVEQLTIAAEKIRRGR